MQQDDDAPEIKALDALRRLRAMVTYERGVKELATQFGVSRSTMSKILKGDAEMNEDMFKAIGVKRVVVLVLDESALPMPKTGRAA